MCIQACAQANDHFGHLCPRREVPVQSRHLGRIRRRADWVKAWPYPAPNPIAFPISRDRRMTRAFAVAVNFRQPLECVRICTCARATRKCLWLSLSLTEQELSRRRGHRPALHLARAQREGTEAEALYPVGLLVRRVCERGHNFAEAVAQLSVGPLWAGAFLIVSAEPRTAPHACLGDRGPSLCLLR